MVAVVVAATDPSETIPLLDNNGSGVYNKGRNNIDEFRQYFIGGLVGKSGGAPFTARNGLFAITAQVGGGWVDGRVISTGGAGTQAISLYAYRAIVNRTGRGPYLVSYIAGGGPIAAPVADALPRKDLFCVMPYDQGAFPSDAQHGPKHIWVTGDPNASPVQPALPAAVADAFVLAVVTRGGSDNTIADVDIAQLSTSTSLHGVPRPLIGAETVGTAGNYHGEIRVRTGSQIDAALITRGHSLQYDYWDEPSATWRNLNAPSLIDEFMPAGNGTLTTTEQMDTTLTFNAVAGHKYKITYSLGHSSGADGNQIICSFRYKAGATVGIADTLIESTRVVRSNIGLDHRDVHNWWIAPTTAQYTIGIGVKMFTGTTGTIYGTGAGNSRRLLIEDGER